MAAKCQGKGQWPAFRVAWLTGKQNLSTPTAPGLRATLSPKNGGPLNCRPRSFALSRARLSISFVVSLTSEHDSLAIPSPSNGTMWIALTEFAPNSAAMSTNSGSSAMLLLIITNASSS